jgi:hypothetical protein
MTLLSRRRRSSRSADYPGRSAGRPARLPPAPPRRAPSPRRRGRGPDHFGLEGVSGLALRSDGGGLDAEMVQDLKSARAPSASRGRLSRERRRAMGRGPAARRPGQAELAAPRRWPQGRRSGRARPRAGRRRGPARDAQSPGFGADRGPLCSRGLGPVTVLTPIQRRETLAQHLARGSISASRAYATIWERHQSVHAQSERLRVQAMNRDGSAVVAIREELARTRPTSRRPSRRRTSQV